MNKGVYYVYNRKVIKNFSIPQGIAHPNIKGLFVHKDLLWVATSSGVSYSNGNQFKIVDGSERFCFEKILKIKDQLNGFTLESGVYELNKNKTELLLDYDNKTYVNALNYLDKVIIGFTKSTYICNLDRLTKLDVPNESLPLFIDGNQVGFSHNKQLLLYNLSRVELSPNFEVSSVSINGKQKLFSEYYFLNAGNYDIRLNLSPIYFGINKEVVYSYKINNKQWNPYQELSSIILNQQEKSFDIEIRAALKGQEHLTSKIIKLRFLIAIPFWKKPIAIVLLFLFIIIVTTTFFVIRNKILRKKNEELELIIHQKTEQIRQEKELIVEKNRTLNAFKETIDRTYNPVVIFNNNGAILYENTLFNQLFTKDKNQTLLEKLEISKKELKELSNNYSKEKKVMISKSKEAFF